MDVQAVRTFHSTLSVGFKSREDVREKHRNGAPPTHSRSQSRERGRERECGRLQPSSYASSPQLRPSPFTPDQTSSRPSSKHSSLLPPKSSSSASASASASVSRSRSRNTSPYPSTFTTHAQDLTDNLLSPHAQDLEGDPDASGLHRQPSTRLETATTIRQPSFPQFRNSIVTKPSISLITRPGIIHVQPGQPLTPNLNSPSTPLSGSTMMSSPLTATSSVITGSPVTTAGRTREARVSVIDVGSSASGSPKSAAGTRMSARASLLAGPGPVVRPAGPRPKTGHAHPQMGADSESGDIDTRNSIEERDISEERERASFLDMKVQRILGPRDENPTPIVNVRNKEGRKVTLGLMDVKKMIEGMKDSSEARTHRPRSQRKGAKAKEKRDRESERGDVAVGGKELWQSMYSMSGETLGEGSGSESGSGLGLGGTRTPDRLMEVDDDGQHSPGGGPDGKIPRGRGGAESGMGWKKWCRSCLGR